MNLDVIIGTCIYNRTHTLKTYFESLIKNTEVKYRVYLIVNFDELWPEEVALREITKICEEISLPENLDVNIIFTDNLGLMGYNIPLEFGRIYDIPVLLCNDDTIFAKDWTTHLLNENITMVEREGKQVPINPKTIGCIGPCYVEPGCMKHQKFWPAHRGYKQGDFVVGHVQLITREALRRGFTFDPNLCSIFGPFDIYQSMKLLSMELNVVISQECCFDFPDSKESHFHNGDHQRFSDKFSNMWKEMQERLNNFQKLHIAKYGFNKQYFD